jgi:hypothetical protein
MALILNVVDTIEPIHFFLASSFTFLDIHPYTYKNVMYLYIHVFLYYIPIVGI